MNKELEDAAKKFVNEKESGTSEKKKSLGNVNDFEDTVGAEQFKEKTHLDIGFQKLNVESFPSCGMFYPENTKVLIKSATAGEIKHWSTIDETDPESINSNINEIIERLTNIQIPNKRGSYKDLLDVDRIYLLFALNEYTFKSGENKIFAEIPLENGETEKIQITKDCLDICSIPDSLKKYYNPLSRSFMFNIDGEEIELTLPSIGVSNFIETYKNNAIREGKKYDQDFALYALFLFKDWRTLNNEVYKKEEARSSAWSLKKISLLSSFVDKIKNAIHTQMRVNTSAGEVTRQLDFQGGLKSLFIIPSILDEFE